MSPTPPKRVLRGPNPFGVLGEYDLLHPVQHDVSDWSETMYFHIWSPAEGVGLFVHIGRWPGDLDLWWGQVIAMLPNGELLADRSWGRAADGRGPATGNVKVTCVEPLKKWKVTFDGAGEPTTRARMAVGPVGAGRATAFRFDVELDAAAPVWDMHAALGFENLSWAAFHHTQGFRCRGSLSVEGDRQWSLDGVAHRDHSSGPRHLADFGGLNFFVAVFPDCGRVANGLVNWRREGQVDIRISTVQQDEVCTIGTDLTITGLSDLATHEPHHLTLTVGVDPPEVYTAEFLHGYTLTLLEPNVNVNGAAMEEEHDPLLVTQGAMKFTAPDGQVGWGVVERDYRRSFLPSPEAR
ncbi:hypothetical protein [Mycobacterium paraintracellulare]|nr:hypothetical protein [Mycobacterium paraintracellulare]